MVQTLTLGGNTNLSQAASPSTLDSVTVGLGWATSPSTDIIVRALRCNRDDRVLSENDCVHTCNLFSPDRTVAYQDILSAGPNSDNVQIRINLARQPSEVEKIIFVVEIRQNGFSPTFNDVRGTYIRVFTDTMDLIRYPLERDGGSNSALIFAELYRDKNNRNQWKFRALAQGYEIGARGIDMAYGLVPS